MSLTIDRPFRVLSLDGGGMRGLYSASVLNTLGQRFSGSNRSIDVGNKFDLIVGTSTGGILACALAAGIEIEKVMDLYRMHGSAIFTSPTPNSPIAKFCWALRHLRSPANKNHTLRTALKEVLGEETVAELYERRKIGICLTSVNIATHKARVFKTAHNPKKNLDDKRKLADICLASSAAPIIFPVAGIPDPETADTFEHFVDGGLWANNPILVALVEALELAAASQPIEILSIGTCPPPSGEALVAREAEKGLLDWNFGIKPLEISMDAQASGHEYIAVFLANRLKKLGKPIQILRLKQTTPSLKQANHLGLDKASEKACSNLIQLGAHDAREAFGKAQDAQSEYTLLKEIFSTSS